MAINSKFGESPRQRPSILEHERPDSPTTIPLEMRGSREGVVDDPAGENRWHCRRPWLTDLLSVAWRLDQASAFLRNLVLTARGAVHGARRSRLRCTQCLLKYCTSRSCCFACSREEKVPRLRRLPVAPSFLREYKRNCPDLSLRIMPDIDASTTRRAAPTMRSHTRSGTLVRTVFIGFGAKDN